MSINVCKQIDCLAETLFYNFNKSFIQLIADENPFCGCNLF